MAFNSRLVALVLPLLMVSLPTLVLAQTVPSQDAAGLEFFEKKIRPLLADNCFNCHSTNTNSRGGLRVDDRNGLISGGDRGAAIVPGDPEKSLLIKAVRQTDKLKMPPMKQLTEQQIADLTKWIQDGAVWPQVEFTLPKGDPSPEYERLRKEHWAWRPLRDVKAPAIRVADWARGEIDQFIQAKLEEQRLTPVSDADKMVLIRRVTFDLTGLPPTLEEIAAFVKDVGYETKAFEKVVDRLLASAAFGERWGRHWLDVARYGESTGSARNLPYPHAWRFRDYVIDALNNDKPYDQFLREQIAGDLLSANSEAQRDEQLIATGFLALGVKDVNQRYKVRFIMDNVDEQIDTVSRAVLGLTASCARCHDHKFDPIPQTDYYALAGIFRSTDLCAGVRNNGPEAQRLMSGSVSSTQRSVYLPLVRNITPTSLDVFDFATQGMVTGSRDTTTVATQALYLLNDPFVRRQSLAFADRLLKQADRDDAARVDLAYQWAMSRSATIAEIERAANYLTEYAATAREVQSPKLAPAGRKAPKRVAVNTSNAQSAAIINPDQVPRDEDQVREEVIEPTDPRHAAWASFCQALLGSAEFRYLK